MHTQFTEESKMATALTPQTDVTSGETYIKSIKNPIKQNKKSIFYLIKSETSDSFVNQSDGHFAYLKTLDFYFNKQSQSSGDRRWPNTDDNVWRFNMVSLLRSFRTLCPYITWFTNNSKDPCKIFQKGHIN